MAVVEMVIVQMGTQSTAALVIKNGNAHTHREGESQPGRQGDSQTYRQTERWEERERERERAPRDVHEGARGEGQLLQPPTFTLAHWHPHKRQVPTTLRPCVFGWDT